MPIEQFMKNLLENILKDIGKGLYKLFDMDKLEFEKIIVEKAVIEDIIDFAVHNHPKEFVAFFYGKINDRKLIIQGLLYQEFHSDENSATPIFHFNDRSFFGSVHSHPGPNNRPSRADKQFFSKTGIIHAIICRPYKKSNIQFYNIHAEKIIVEISE